jgi:AAA family ATP:ADP antiporter
MNKLMHKLLDIREGEGMATSLMFTYLFLLIASLLIVKPMRNSLFLTIYGAQKLPYVFVLVAIAAGIVTHFYAKTIKKVRLDVLIIYTTAIAIFSLILFWIFFTTQMGPNWLYFVFYIWVALFGVITTSQFWLLANYVFNARQAKRLFGLIGAGGISGGIFGGYLTKFLAPVIGTNNMIFFTLLFLGACFFILNAVWRHSAKHNYSERLRQQRRLSKTYSTDNAFKLLKQSKHLLFIAILVGISVLVANLVDYQYSAIASKAIPQKDDLTAFFGFWLSNLSILSLFIQLVLTSRILKTFGVTFSLFFLPIGIFTGALFTLFNPTLWSAVMIKIGDGSFKQSINKAGLELLLLPLPGSVKNQGKSFIDVFVDSSATGLGGLLLILLVDQMGFKVPHISIVIIILIAVWILAINQARKEYIDSFRQALEKRSIDLEDQTINLEDASVIKSLIYTLESDNPRNILYALRLLENAKSDEFVPHLKSLFDHPSDEIKRMALRLAAQSHAYDFSSSVTHLVKCENIQVSVEAIHYLYHHSSDGLKLYHQLLQDPNYKIQSAVLRFTAIEFRESKEFRKQVSFIDIFNRFIEKIYNNIEDKSGKRYTRLILADVIGIAREPELYPFLQRILQDRSDTRVLSHAINSAGKTHDPSFIPLLIQHLNTKMVRRSAREALAEYGDAIIDILADYMRNPQIERRIRLGIPKVLALIGSQKSINLFIDHLDQNDLDLRYAIIRALNKLNNQFSWLEIDIERIENRIYKETEKYFKTLSLLIYQKRDLKAVPSTHKDIVRAKALLSKALEERLADNLERIFRLLALEYSPRDIYNAYLALNSGKADQKANAIEFLDNVLSFELKRVIIPIIEQSNTSRVHEHQPEPIENHVDSDEEIIRVILEEDDNWLKICAIHLAAESGITRYKWMIEKLVTDSDKALRETAVFALKKLSQSDA